MTQAILSYWWPDLPRSTGALSPIEVISEEHTWADAGYDAPVGQSLQASFRGFSALQTAYAKLQFSSPTKYSNVIAPWFNQINDFLWGGTTQHSEQVGNLCADLNGMGRAAQGIPRRRRRRRTPVLRDGRHRRARGHGRRGPVPAAGQQATGHRQPRLRQIPRRHGLRNDRRLSRHPQLGIHGQSPPGSKFSSVSGMFGGYGCPTYPLSMVKNINIYDIIRKDPSQFDLSIERVMNEQPYEGGKYLTGHMGLQFDVAKEGELYMISQGSGGGYGDILERDPELVMADLQLARISDKVAGELYGVVYEPDTFVVREEDTTALRAQMRQDRLKRGKPYKEFVAEFVKPETSERAAVLRFLG